MKRWKQAAGFTLVELIVVIAILGILAGVAVPTYSGYVKKANEAADNQLLGALNTAFASSCIENGEGDLKNLSVRPQANIDDDGIVTLNDYYNDGFQRYFANSGVFKHYDILGFDTRLGMFVGSSVDELMKILNESWDGSSFKDKDGIVQDMLSVFDTIGTFFTQGNFTYSSLDVPDVVVKAFGFDKLDITDEEAEAYLKAKYGAAWDSMENKSDLIQNYKANASVMAFVNGAAGCSSEVIMSDLTNFMMAMRTEPTEEQVKAYYAKYKPDGAATEIQDMLDEIAIENMIPYGGALVALEYSGVTNSSGISTLGSMYALAMGYYHSDLGKNSATKPGENELEKYGHFPTVLAAAQEDAFWEYLGFDAETGSFGADSQGAKDIDAYLGFMNYLSTSGVDMTIANAFGGQNDYMSDALSK